MVQVQEEERKKEVIRRFISFFIFRIQCFSDHNGNSVAKNGLSLKTWGIALKFLFCIMKTSSPQTIDPVASLSLFLPSGILDYFTLVNHVSQDTCFILYLEEKATIPSEYSDLHLHSKGFLPEIEVQDFPIRGKAVYLRIKRRRWEDPSTGQTYSRDWSLVATGTRITAEFGAFLKELLR